MAQKRMFSLNVLETDAFMDMPLSAQALYFHLCLRADDDGFIGNPKRVAMLIGASQDDLKLLIAKSFVIAFEDGVIVIKHWRMHNAIKSDRYHKTNFTEDYAMLGIKDNGAYTLSGTQLENKWSQDGTQTLQMSSPDKVRLDKDRLGKDRLDNTLCAESLTDSTPTISFLLNDGSLYPIFQEQIDEWQTLYPAVDVMQELRKIVGWCSANPSKRKTRKGALRFVNAWLAKEQDKPHKEKRKSFSEIADEMESEGWPV